MIHGGGGDASQRSEIEEKLKEWKNVIVTVDDGLRLREVNAAVIVYSLSLLAVFFLWLYEPPILALLSITGIFSVLAEQLAPALSELVFGETKKTWTTSKCVRFREICSEICYHQNNLKELQTWLQTQKLQKPLVYVVIVFSCLSVVSYVSFRFSNLWLMYLLFLAANVTRWAWYEWDKLAAVARAEKKD